MSSRNKCIEVHSVPEKRQFIDWKSFVLVISFANQKLATVQTSKVKICIIQLTTTASQQLSKFIIKMKFNLLLPRNALGLCLWYKWQSTAQSVWWLHMNQKSIYLTKWDIPYVLSKFGLFLVCWALIQFILSNFNFFCQLDNFPKLSFSFYATFSQRLHYIFVWTVYAIILYDWFVWDCIWSLHKLQK